jgi:hypothetical protein
MPYGISIGMGDHKAGFAGRKRISLNTSIPVSGGALGAARYAVASYQGEFRGGHVATRGQLRWARH